MKKIGALLLSLVLLLCLPTAARAAGQVTDTLTIKVGYFGMDTADYVELATYHWSELYENLPLHQNAYSFFRSGSDGTYRTVIDSAYGFYLADLFDYAGVYTGDILSVQFYTRDQEIGYFTSFTAAELFRTQRYYFNDLAAHIHSVYDEKGNFVEYDASEAWNDCWTVPPMLALEDSWVTYEIGMEHTAPNYTSLGTGNRFRLLFGQSSPMECRTNQSAKYTHTLYVTLDGAPQIQDMPPELDGTVGSHTVSFSVSAGNRAILEALARLLRITSSDSSILEITGVTVTLSGEFSDLATVTVSYTVHRSGSVSLSIGCADAAITPPLQIEAREPSPQPTEPQPSDAQPPDPQPTETPADGNSQDATGGGQESLLPQGQQGDPATQEPTQSSNARTDGVRLYAIPSELAQQLQRRAASDTSPGESDSDALLPAVRTALSLQAKEDRLSRLLTALSALLLAVGGAVCAKTYYKKERIDP